jgi:hypothetical protein
MERWLIDMWTKFKANLLKAHKSLTIWFNGLVGMAVMALPFAQDNMPQLQDYLPADVYHYAMGAVIVGNILLRFKTTSSLAEK